MESVILILALLVVVIMGLGIYLGVKAVRAAKRGVDRTITQARRTVEDTALRAKSFGQPGPAGELAQLRLSLRKSMTATEQALQAGAAEDSSLSESLALFQRLRSHADELDAELKRAEREPDKSRVLGRLPEMRERTRQVTSSADSLRHAAQERAHRFAQDDLAQLSRQIEMESGALRHWTPAPGATDTSPAASAGTAPGATGSPAARDADGGAGGTERAGDTPAPGVATPGAAGPATAESPRPALDAPPEHTWQPGHSWQRSAHPENG
ncbi:hypothetical protein [Streptomyces sp. NPDC018031]|uniref:hypothetical protein n=1 Tax=Streptomyces sp. NPDC018031 TaxID=3365033 RepID=UPI0037A9666F